MTCIDGVNPFSQGSWSGGRIDMGVDMIPNHREPMRAIGAAKILGSTSHSGKTFARFLYRVGLPHVLDIKPQGSSHPTGKLC